MVQATGADQPKWFLNDGVLFDGMGQQMKTDTFTFEQPEFIYIVIKQVAWVENRYLFDGFSNNSGYLTQRTESPKLRLYAGNISPDNGNLAVGSFGIIRILYNGANSSFQINETTKLIGDYGSLDMNGITLGARADGVTPGNFQVKELILRKVADTTLNEMSIYNYLSKKYGI